ncbi:hypothetical protein [Mobilicoccus pelagius]|uniref:Uncharacterized protein n=1 Tax=Mobilicoccus pelagius NBRC 104925 TaxID=1089455 RepID=H5USY9_9MICO|nr:hypothetical protein [Mobilicoccus pelagius]GAB48847.1 hypothetical protein MOPEL_083_00520 [Mobilicoccus pelagius NBRC 104925]
MAPLVDEGNDDAGHARMNQRGVVEDMGLRRHGSEDDDPELRRLLAGMSTPATVPEDLAARISRSIAEEHHASAGLAHRFDPATARPRRRTAVLGATAAGVLAVGGVLAAVGLHVDDDVVVHQAQAAWGALGGEGSDDGTSIEASGSVDALPPMTLADPGVGTEPDLVTGTDAGRDALAGLTVVTSGTDYRPRTLAGQVDAVSDGRMPDVASTDPAPRVPSRDAIARCLAASGLSPRQAFVDVATYEGRPALVLLGDPTAPSTPLLDPADPAPPASGDVPELPGTGRTVVVRPPACGASATRPLAGPLAVP